MVDLNKPFDLKNIDINTIISDVLKQKLVLAKVAAVIIAIAIVVLITVNFLKMKSEANERMVKLHEKLAKIGLYKSSRQAFEAFVNGLPEHYAENDFVNAIADFAEKSSVEVQSFSPVNISASTYVDVAVMKLNVVGKNFKDLVNFMRNMEDSKYSLRINNFSFSSVSDTQISLTLTISTVKTNKR